MRPVSVRGVMTRIIRGCGAVIVAVTACGALAAVVLSANAVKLEPKLTDAAALAKDWELDGTGTWAIREGLLALEKPGTPGGPIRRPSALAILRSAPLGDVTLTLDARSTAAEPPVTPRRDILLIVGYQSPARFYYVHVSAVRDDVHNGIFLVADADRRRIDTQSQRAILHDRHWHRLRVTRTVSTGRIEVFADDMREPIMVATDTTIPSGRVGVGSFDDTGEFRDIRVTGDAAQ
jgi:hypothetical protein